MLILNRQPVWMSCEGFLEVGAFGRRRRRVQVRVLGLWGLGVGAVSALGFRA